MNQAGNSDDFCLVCQEHLMRRFAPNRTDNSRIRSFAHAGSEMTEINISASVTAIGDYAFLRADNLRVIRAQRLIPQQINDTTFAGVVRSNILVYIPVGRYAQYRAAGWTGFLLVEGQGATNPTITPEIGRHRIADDRHFSGTDEFYFVSRWIGYSSNAYIAIPNILRHSEVLFPNRPIIGATLRFNFSSNRSNSALRAQVRNTTHQRYLRNANSIMNLTVNHPNTSSGVANIDVFNHLNTLVSSGGIGIITLYDTNAANNPVDCGRRVTFSNIELILDFAGLIIDGTTVTGFVAPPNFQWKNKYT